MPGRSGRCSVSVPDCCRRDWKYQQLQAVIRYTHRIKDRNLGRYIGFLEEKEKGKYDRHGCLIPEALAGDVKPRELRIPGIPVLHGPTRPRVPRIFQKAAAL